MNGEKTVVYWIGLILLSTASVALFGIFWIVAFTIHPINRANFMFRSPLVPAIVGGVVFMFIGLYMMQEGAT